MKSKVLKKKKTKTVVTKIKSDKFAD